MAKRTSNSNSKLPSDLAKRCTRLRELFATSLSAELQTGYKIAIEVHAVRQDKARYGERGVATIADELGRTAALLYSYANVAARWTPGEFETLSARKTSRGQPLSFNHFVEVARANGEEVRKRVLELAFDKALSIRDLKSEVRRSKPPRKKPISTATIVGRLRSASESALQQVIELAKSLDEVLERQAPEDRLPTVDAIELVEETYKSLQQHQAEIVGRLAPVKSRIAKGGEVAPPEMIDREGGADGPDVVAAE